MLGDRIIIRKQIGLFFSQTKVMAQSVRHVSEEVTFSSTRRWWHWEKRVFSELVIDPRSISGREGRLFSCSGFRLDRNIL